MNVLWQSHSQLYWIPSNPPQPVAALYAHLKTCSYNALKAYEPKLRNTHIRFVICNTFSVQFKELWIIFFIFKTKQFAWKFCFSFWSAAINTFLFPDLGAAVQFICPKFDLQIKTGQFSQHKSVVKKQTCNWYITTLVVPYVIAIVLSACWKQGTRFTAD